MGNWRAAWTVGFLIRYEMTTRQRGGAGAEMGESTELDGVLGLGSRSTTAEEADPVDRVVSLCASGGIRARSSIGVRAQGLVSSTGGV